MKKVLRPKEEKTIVVGAGVAGLGAAIGLARAGRKVLVIAKRRKGAASPAAGGILDPFLEMSPNHPLFKISREAFHKYPQLVRRVESLTGMKTGYKKTGMLFIAMNHADMRELERRYAWQRKTGIPVVWRSRLAVLKKHPSVTQKLLAGLFYPTIARVHPKPLMTALETYARLLGVTFKQTKARVSLFLEKKEAAGVRVGRKVFYAREVVGATGAWAGLGEVGPRCPVSPAKGQILVVQSQEKNSTILHSLDGGYIVPWETVPAKAGFKNYLLGSTVEKGDFRYKPTAGGLRKIIRKNVNIMPGLANAKRLEAWAGLRPFSEKKIPLIGPSKIKRFYVAAGYYRSGILIGCYAGELLAQAIVSGKMPSQIRAFNPRRFSL